jgi:hypothetical protein
VNSASSEQKSGLKSEDFRSASSKIRRIAFDVAAVDLVAETLDVQASVAPFRLPSGAVFLLLVPSKDDRPAVMLTLWPSIHRVDAISPSSTIVFTDVVSVDLVADVEVQFRRLNRDYLIVARGGKVIVRA